jgi:hypothetical protein
MDVLGFICFFSVIFSFVLFYRESKGAVYWGAGTIMSIIAYAILLEQSLK